MILGNSHTIIAVIKQFVRGAFNAIGYDIHKIPSTPTVQDRREFAKDHVPWSQGYLQARWQLVAQAITESEYLERFRSGDKLPDGYGFAIDERCVEYPWVFSRLSTGMQRLLDAGSTLNHALLLDHPLITTKRLHILTLFPESHCYWQRRVSYIYEDLRDIPIRDEYYDEIVCISTLEHVGMDNTLYGDENPDQQLPNDYLLALNELRRVLRRDGRLFLTVPYGRYVNGGSYQQFDSKMVLRVIDSFMPAQVETTYYRYSEHGWNIAARERCDDAEYVDWIMKKPPERSEFFPLSHDHAAAARAVACLVLTKN